jgi:hypothetical protein
MKPDDNATTRGSVVSLPADEHVDVSKAACEPLIEIDKRVTQALSQKNTDSGFSGTTGSNKSNHPGLI